MQWGVSVHILDLCKNYSQMKCIDKIVVCCDGGEHINALASIEKVYYVRIPFYDEQGKMKSLLRCYKAMEDVIENELIDIIHVHSQRILPIAFLLKMFRKIPYVWTNHIDKIPQPRVFRLMCKLMKFPIISVSTELRHMMIEKYHCNEKNVFLVNNGTDVSELIPLSENEKEEIESKYHIQRTETPYVLSLLSRISTAKGHKYLLEAIVRVPYKNKIKLIIAGHTYPTDIEYRRNLESYCEENEINVEFLDYSKPRDVFGISDIFVLPSIWEGFGLVCIEALAMECAVIRSDTPGWQEMQDYVEVVPKKDVNALKNAICRVIEHDMNREKTMNGNAKVREFYTKERCAEETVQVYKYIITDCKGKI